MKQIIDIRIDLFYNNGETVREAFNNTQDACSYLETKKCYNKENRHKWKGGEKDMVRYKPPIKGNVDAMLMDLNEDMRKMEEKIARRMKK